MWTCPNCEMQLDDELSQCAWCGALPDGTPGPQVKPAHPLGIEPTHRDPVDRRFQFSLISSLLAMFFFGCLFSYLHWYGWRGAPALLVATYVLPPFFAATFGQLRLAGYLLVGGTVIGFLLMCYSCAGNWH